MLFSCNEKTKNNSDLLKSEKTIEEKIFELLPTDFTENGFSKAGFLEGDANIYIGNGKLNVTYLINGSQITERGVAQNSKLVVNDNGEKMIQGQWDNLDAGDGKFIILLKKGNKIYFQVEGLEGSSWWYKAETKISREEYDKLFYLFNGYINENKIKNDSQNDTLKGNYIPNSETLTNTTDESDFIKIDSEMFGDWHNDDLNGTLSISKEEITFSGGPFSEHLSARTIDGVLELFFDSIDGSISFNDSTNNDGKKSNCKKLIGKCYLKDNILIFEGFGDECGQLPKGKFKLIKT